MKVSFKTNRIEMSQVVASAVLLAVDGVMKSLRKSYESLDRERNKIHEEVASKHNKLVKAKTAEARKKLGPFLDSIQAPASLVPHIMRTLTFKDHNFPGRKKLEESIKPLSKRLHDIELKMRIGRELRKEFCEGRDCNQEHAANRILSAAYKRLHKGDHVISSDGGTVTIDTRELCKIIAEEIHAA